MSLRQLLQKFRRSASALLLLMIVSAVGHAQTNASFLLDHIEGISPTDSNALEAGTPITFYFKLSWSSSLGCSLEGITNCVRVYSPDGAQWSPLVADTIAGTGLTQYWDFFVVLREWGNDGMGEDTVGIGGAIFVQSGLPSGYDKMVFKVSTEIGSDMVGKTICLDSTSVQFGYVWLWVGSDPCNVTYPEWNGERCFEIVSGCCSGNRGNVNSDPDDLVNISDLTYLISYLFGQPNGPPPICTKEANANGDPDEAVNIADVTYLASFLFGNPGGPAPPGCP